MKTILTLDVGTSSCRAVVYDQNGAVLYSAGHEYHSEYPRPLYIEQEPATWIDAADDVLARVGQLLRRDGIVVEGIAVTSQRTSLIPLDGEGRPLRKAIMWQDKRNIGECEAIIREHGLERLYGKTGLRVNPIFALTKMKWLRDHEPEVFAASRYFIGVQDWVVYHLTGKFRTDWTQASRTMLMDLTTFRWDPELLEIVDLDEERLCELIPPGGIAGELRGEVAARAGLPAGLPVVISGGDQQCAAVGLGVFTPGTAEANTGTGSFVLSYSERPALEPECRVLCQASAVAGKWMMEAGIFNTGAIFRWFKEQFCRDLPDSGGGFEAMTAEAAMSPAGANGVMLLPHFEGSLAPNWNPAAKGIFFNLGLGVTRADMVRAILDGIALEIRDNLNLIQKITSDIQEVSVAGGMVRSDLFCQIQANAYDRRVIRYDNAEASSLGATMVASRALGVHGTLGEAFAAMRSEKCDTIEPQSEEARTYERLGVRKKRLYDALESEGVYAAFLDSV